MIVYVAQAYSKYMGVNLIDYNLHSAYVLACETYKQLEAMGFTVYSPIKDSHPYHLCMDDQGYDYVAHDLKLLEGFMHHDTCCSKYSKCINTIPNEYGYYLLIDRDSECAEETCNGYSHKCEEFMGNKFDSGVVCVFADDCFAYTGDCVAEDCRHNSHEDKMFCYGCKRYWDSNGAKAEYNFAHAHHIKCIRLTDLLEKKQIDLCDPF